MKKPPRKPKTSSWTKKVINSRPIDLTKKDHPTKTTTQDRIAYRLLQDHTPDLPKEIWMIKRFLEGPGEIIGQQSPPRKGFESGYVRYVMAKGKKR